MGSSVPSSSFTDDIVRCRRQDYSADVRAGVNVQSPQAQEMKQRRGLWDSHHTLKQTKKKKKNILGYILENFRERHLDYHLKI